MRHKSHMAAIFRNCLSVLFRQIWNGPFYIGPLSQPVSVGDVLLKILETGWRLIISLIILCAGIASTILGWIYVIGPTFFPPLKDSIQISARFDDGKVLAPPSPRVGPPVVTMKTESVDEFRCTEDHPIRVEITNSSTKAIDRVSFNITASRYGYSEDLVQFGGFQSSTAIIEPGYAYTTCRFLTLEDGVHPTEVMFEASVLNVAAHD